MCSLLTLPPPPPGTIIRGVGNGATMVHKLPLGKGWYTVKLPYGSHNLAPCRVSPGPLGTLILRRLQRAFQVIIMEQGELHCL